MIMNMLTCRRSLRSHRTTSLDNNDVDSARETKMCNKRCVMKFIVLQLLSYSFLPARAIHKNVVLFGRNARKCRSPSSKSVYDWVVNNQQFELKLFDMYPVDWSSLSRCQTCCCKQVSMQTNDFTEKTVSDCFVLERMCLSCCYDR